MIIAFLLASGAIVAQAIHPPSVEQTHFSAEDESVASPVAIPKDVLAIIARDEIVRDIMANETPSLTEVPPSWFSASLIHLERRGNPDLIVEAEGKLEGANITTFWVFVPRPKGYRLVLTAEAHDLAEMAQRSKGFHDIGIDGCIRHCSYDEHLPMEWNAICKDSRGSAPDSLTRNHKCAHLTSKPASTPPIKSPTIGIGA